ncbi:MAG: hypothetical protein ABI844_04810 [Saprospiraceae bacterium]
MKSPKLFFLIFGTLFFVSTLSSQVSSRSRKQTPAEIRRNAAAQKKAEKMKTLADHLWYGGGFGLSFSSGYAGLPGNTFTVGLSPMMGYKLNKIFSVGPRITVQYTNGRFNQGIGAPVAKFNGFDYGAGVFARAKIFPTIFAHTEIGYINYQYPTGYLTANNKLETARYGDNQFLAGLGYTSGGLFKTEIYLLYDFLSNNQSTQLPIVYRFGITYKF